MHCLEAVNQLQSDLNCRLEGNSGHSTLHHELAEILTELLLNDKRNTFAGRFAEGHELREPFEAEVFEPLQDLDLAVERGLIFVFS